MRRSVIAFAAALLPWPALADAAADARAAARLESALEGLSSLRAEFRQTVTDANGELKESAEGTVFLARPGRFRWDYRSPPQLIVSDGATVWLYDVDLAQVTIRPAAETLAGTPALLLAGQGDLEASFDIADGGRADGLAWIRLAPRGEDGDFREMRVGIEGEEIRRMTLLDRLGQTTQLDFSRVDRNPRLDAGTFSFTPPPGVDVVGSPSPGES